MLQTWWRRTVEPALAALPGPGIVTEPNNKAPSATTPSTTASATATATPTTAAANTATTSLNQGRRKVVLVFFLGGCTLAEISALRFLSGGGIGTGTSTVNDAHEGGWDVVVATTKLLRGDALIESLFETVGRMSLST